MDEYGITLDDKIVLVMGPVGIGKSTFINYAIGDGSISRDLKTSTSDITVLRTQLGTPPQSFAFVDTQGFDDADDIADILWFVMEALEGGYQLDRTLYLHPVFEDPKEPSPAEKLELAEALAEARLGRIKFPRATFVEMMWSGSKREETGWQQVQDKLKQRGCDVVQFGDGMISAQGIILGESVLGPSTMNTVQGITKKLYDISIEETPEVEQATTVQELTNSLDDYVQDRGLNRFFAPGDSFLQNLAIKAADLMDDKTTCLGEPENLKRLTILSLYQPVIYCDDSGSMYTDNRYLHQQELVSRIASVATRIVPDEFGIELRFINSDVSYSNSAQGIMKVIQSVWPDGWTAIGSGLHDKILKPSVYDVISKPGGRLQRPILVCVITDGGPSQELSDAFREEIRRCRHNLVAHGYEPNSVVFCINQIGNDPDAGSFLDSLREDEEIKDVIYVAADRIEESLKKEEKELEVWLLKLLTSPLMGSTD